MDNELRNYLARVQEIPTLTHDKEMELAERIKEFGTTDAKQSLLQANLRLVVKIAEKLSEQYPKTHLLELIKRGNIGLSKAVDKFDYEKAENQNYTFSAYATWWIRQSIMSEFERRK